MIDLQYISVTDGLIVMFMLFISPFPSPFLLLPPSALNSFFILLCLLPCQGAIICNLPKSSICWDAKHENEAIWCKMEAGRHLSICMCVCECIWVCRQGKRTVQALVGGHARTVTQKWKWMPRTHTICVCVYAHKGMFECMCAPTSLHTWQRQSDPLVLKCPTHSPTSPPCNTHRKQIADLV